MKKNFIHMAKKLQGAAFIFSFILLISQSANAQTTFSTHGTYTFHVSSLSNNVVIEVWGAGGSGGGGNSGNGARGGGGGGGYSRTIVNLAAGNYTVIVGAGGVAPSSSGNGQDGGGSSFRNGSTIIDSASGGIAGSNNTSASLPIGSGGTGIPVSGNGSSKTFHTGGSGGLRDVSSGNGGGGGGGSPTSGANGNSGTNGSGNTGGVGGTGQGNGGSGGNNGAPGGNGFTPGGGGGGKGNTGNLSGNGFDGRVVITSASGGSLPVKFGDFRAYQKQSRVQLEWNTYTEVNVSHFEIERSSDGINFSSIGQIAATNIISGSAYSWFDAAALSGNNFYRIMIVDIDSKSDYSSIVRINLSNSTGDGISIYPNPVVGNRLSFQASDMQQGVYNIIIYDNSGRRLYMHSFIHTGGALSQSMQLPSSIKPGMYNIQFISGDLKISVPFFVQ